MDLRKEFAYSLIVPTSMGVRITPVNGQPVHSSDTFMMQATSAETNVASISSFLGLPVKVLTTFVKGSPIAQFIKSNLAGRHMAYEGKKSLRAVLGLSSSVYNSRQRIWFHAARGQMTVPGGRQNLNVQDLTSKNFNQEGAQILHFRLIGALSHETSIFCLELARAQKNTAHEFHST